MFIHIHENIIFLVAVLHKKLFFATLVRIYDTISKDWLPGTNGDAHESFCAGRF